MFILTTITDLVQISPEDFQKPSAESLQDNINAKYANKVIPQIGLAITLYDMLHVSDGIIGNGTGKANVNVTFRLIVFRPFKGEIILGQISSASEEGIRVRLDFFDDILVPPHLLLPNSHFNIRERVWQWTNDADEYYYDKSEWVRIRIEDETWARNGPTSVDSNDTNPTRQNQNDSTAGSGASAGTETGAGGGAAGAAGGGPGATTTVLDKEAERNQTPWSITASMMQAGLGPVEWW